jgi:hypothetical protein
VITFEFNDKGLYVDTWTGEEYVPGLNLPFATETMPQWLWDQHSGVPSEPPKEDEP